MLDFSRVLLSSSFVLGLTACYTVEFDEQKDDAYYCQSAAECLETQTCAQFHCVDDRGPHITITGPELDPPTVLPTNSPSVNVSLDIQDFMLDESDAMQEGLGKVVLTLDPHADSPITALIDTSQAQLSLGAGLTHGPHRVVAQAVYGNGTAYDNPSSKDHTVFFASNGSARPQIAILEPGPGHIHVAGEPLEVQVINIGFSFVSNGDDCHVQEGCDPYDPDQICTVEMGCTEMSNIGHTHIYLLENYPACLSDVPVGCNENYIASMRPDAGENGDEVTSVIPGDRFPEAGEFVLSAGMQYNNHAPFPNIDYVVFDQIPITIIER